MVMDRGVGGSEFLYGLGPFQHPHDHTGTSVWQNTCRRVPSLTPANIAARHTLIMFGALRCEKDSLQIVKTLAGDSAASERNGVCQSVEFKSWRTSSDVVLVVVMR